MKNLLRGLLAGIFIAMMFAWSYTYDTDTPLGSDAPSVIDNRIREIKDAVQERENVDHYWALTGTEVSDASAGEHRKITFYSTIADPTQVSGKAHLYMKDDELYFQDDTNTTLKLTSGGTINIASGDLLGTVANDTYFTGVDNAGTGTVDLIKADTNDVAVVPDDSQTASNAAPTQTKAIANKKYVDDQVATEVGAVFDLDGSTVFNTTMTAVMTWQDLDLSAYVGTNAALVFLEVTSDADRWLYIKPKGYGSATVLDHQTGYYTGGGIVNTNAGDYTYLLMATDSSGVLQIAGNYNTGTYTIKLVCRVK